MEKLAYKKFKAGDKVILTADLKNSYGVLLLPKGTELVISHFSPAVRVINGYTYFIVCKKDNSVYSFGLDECEKIK